MLKVFGLEQQNEWHAIVESFREHDVYWLPEYTKAFRIHGDGEPKLFYYEDGYTRAINVVMLRDIHDFKPLSAVVNAGEWFDIVTPYGYGGWLIEGKNSPFEEYETYCREHNIVSEFVRFHPLVKNHIRCTKAYEVIELGETVAFALTSPDNIWNNLRSNCRGRIRKAMSSGVTVEHGNSMDLYDVFMGIYNKTMDRDDAVNYYYFSREFYESVCNDLHDNAQIFYARYEDKIIAAYIVLSCNGFQNYHLGGTLTEYLNLAPSNMLMYQSACWGSENGNKSYYLGGGLGSSESELLRFKKTFSKNEDMFNHFFIGKKVFIPEKYDELITMRTDLPDSGYFPKYRAE